MGVEVGTIPLEEILLEVASEAGFALEVRGDLGETRPQAFEGVPIEQGIRRLVGDNRVHLLFRYEMDSTGEPRLTEVLARGAGAVPPEMLRERRMRTELSRVRVPPPPPPPPAE